MTLRPVCRMVSLACLFCFPNVLRGICLLYNYAYIYTWVHEQKTTLKETVLWGTITWSEMGKQNIQDKKVSSITMESISVFLSYFNFLVNLCEEFNLQSGGPSFLFVFGGLIAGYARFEK